MSEELTRLYHDDACGVMLSNPYGDLCSYNQAQEIINDLRRQLEEAKARELLNYQKYVKAVDDLHDSGYVICEYEKLLKMALPHIQCEDNIKHLTTSIGRYIEHDYKSDLQNKHRKAITAQQAEIDRLNNLVELFKQRMAVDGTGKRWDALEFWEINKKLEQALAQGGDKA